MAELSLNLGGGVTDLTAIEERLTALEAKPAVDTSKFALKTDLTGLAKQADLDKVSTTANTANTAVKAIDLTPYAKAADITAHTSNVKNPHKVTLTQLSGAKAEDVTALQTKIAELETKIAALETATTPTTEPTEGE